MNVVSLQLSDLPELLQLYAFLHPEDPQLNVDDPRVKAHWAAILADPRLHYFGAKRNDSANIVSTCTLTIIPNLTRKLRPYGVIENVVTAPAFRNRGMATAVLKFALATAWERQCYKVMLETGSKLESTFRFYEQAGFQRGVKTGFIAYPNSEAKAPSNF